MESERMHDHIDTLIKQQGDTSSSLLKIVDKLVDSNAQATKDAVRPIGTSCNTLQIGPKEEAPPVIDLPTADVIRAEGELEVSNDKTFRAKLDSVTLHTKACRVELADNPGRFIAGKITDPQLLIPENVYTLALHKQQSLELQGKTVTKEGEIKTIYISHARIVD